MSQFLDTLKERMLDAQKRLEAAQRQLQVVQSEYQTVAQEFQSWKTLVEVEIRKEQVTTGGTPAGPPLPASVTNKLEGNKTEAIRELLRQHPAGMTPTDIYKEVKIQFPHRAYLYSVLKRLKDKGEVIERRGKYIAKIMPKPEENTEQMVIEEKAVSR